MTRLSNEVAHLLWLMEPPFTEGWKAYCWAKANALADAEPDVYQDLPRLLKEAMQSASNQSTRPQQSTDE